MDFTETYSGFLDWWTINSFKRPGRLSWPSCAIFIPRSATKTARPWCWAASACTHRWNVSSTSSLCKVPALWYRISLTSSVNQLQVFLRSGQLTIYELVPSGQNVEYPERVRSSYLKIIFVKIASMAFEIQRQEEGEKSIIAEQKRISRNFLPFVTSPTPGVTFSGVFFTGDRPNWILAGNKGGVQIYPSGHSVVHAFAACSLWDSKGDFLLYTDEVWIFFACTRHTLLIHYRLF